MNSWLDGNCAEKDIPFINIYDHLVDENGWRKKEMIYDFSHLNSKTADLVMSHYSFEHQGATAGQNKPELCR